MEIIAYKGRPSSVFVDGFVSHFALLQLYINIRDLANVNAWKTMFDPYILVQETSLYFPDQIKLTE